MNKQSRGETHGPTIEHDTGHAGSTSACGHHPNAKVTDVLMEEHRVIERVLALIRQ